MKLNSTKYLEVKKVGEVISQDLGIKMVKDFQDAHPNDVKSYLIGREIIEKILSQPTCAGIKLYNGLDELGEKTLVCVGLDQNSQIISEITYVNDLGKIEKQPGIVADRVKKDAEDDGINLAMWV